MVVAGVGFQTGVEGAFIADLGLQVDAGAPATFCGRLVVGNGHQAFVFVFDFRVVKNGFLHRGFELSNLLGVCGAGNKQCCNSEGEWSAKSHSCMLCVSL